jgi:hypothetical protein
VLLKEYRFEHPKTERSITIGRWSYIWAGLFGALYVWRVGFGSVLQALTINIAVAIGVVAIVFGSSVLASVQQLLVLLALGPVAILVQGTMMISLIRDGVRKRGWFVRVA